ncbi:MAG: peptide chain release factor N(5)-glutamine methyltransferase [Pseudomonadota bacterium]|nr:peptide chain release factor N(5)-glutamine methyltransferase [Pseudomonadota bacterium]
MSDTVGLLLKEARQALEKAGIPNAARDARLLVAHATQRRVDRLSLEMHDHTDDHARYMLVDLVAARIQRRPMSQILGWRDFFKHRFHVTEATLDPRPETEALVIAALNSPFRRLLDLGTGTGAIAISLLGERPSATGVATDYSAGALAVARSNAEHIGVIDRLELVESDWFSTIDCTFDLIVSNPPYIALDEMPSLAPELSYEPRMALTDEADGLTAYRKIAAGAPAHLNPDGWLMVEIGWQQGSEVAALFEDAGLRNVAIKPDLDRRDRVVIGQKL